MPQITTSIINSAGAVLTQPGNSIPVGTASGGVTYGTILNWGANKNNFTAAVVAAGTVTAGTANLYLSHDGINFWAVGTAVSIVSNGTVNISVNAQVADYAVVGVSTWSGGGTISATIAAAL